jgi:hypothetical protein
MHDTELSPYSWSSAIVSWLFAYSAPFGQLTTKSTLSAGYRTPRLFTGPLLPTGISMAWPPSSVIIWISASGMDRENPVKALQHVDVSQLLLQP